MESTTVRSVMHPVPVTVSPGDTLATAQAAMEQQGAHQLPVIEADRLVGIVSERDMHAHVGYFDRTKVDAAMTSEVVTLKPDDSVEQAALVLMERKFRAIPVVEGDHLVGIVSVTDLLRLLIELLRQQS